MAVDYSKLAKKSVQNTEKDSVKFDEGDSLVLLVTCDPSFPEGLGYVEGSFYQGKVNALFKRSVIDFTCPLAQSERFQSYLGFDLTEDLVGNWARENLTAAELKTAEPKEQYFWVACVVAHRRKVKDPWTWIYTKPKVMTAKRGGATKPHIQSEIERLIAENGADIVPKLFDLEAAQLLIVNRVGTGQYDTIYKLSLATGNVVLANSEKKDNEPVDLEAFCVPQEIRDDIIEATRPNGPCDLFAHVVNKFAPTPEEMEKRFSGQYDDGPKKPGLEE